MKNEVRVFEVGPRDGLQNERRLVAREHKLRFVRDLVAAGIRELELGAFVRTDKVPPMKDTDWIFRQISAGKLKLGKARAWSLVPNAKGLERALSAKAKHIAVFTAATDAFNDSAADAIGIDTVRSQVSPTRRDSPRPSDPTTTTSGSVASSRSSSPVLPSASRPTT